jgi:hypothetical protein
MLDACWLPMPTSTCCRKWAYMYIPDWELDFQFVSPEVSGHAPPLHSAEIWKRMRLTYLIMGQIDRQLFRYTSSIAVPSDRVNDLSRYRKTRRSFHLNLSDGGWNRGLVYAIILSSGLDESYVFSLVNSKLAARIKGTMAGATGHTARKMLLSNIHLRLSSVLKWVGLRDCNC